MFSNKPILVVQEPEQYSPTSGLMSFDMDLCSLLQTMNLDDKKPSGSAHARGKAPPEESMTDLSCQWDVGSESSESSSSTDTAEGYYGCAYLQVIQSQIDNYPTTGGEYVEAIFTHREIFASRPESHRDCARAFSDIAMALEKRAWRADRESDVEAVSTFRHEAWVVATSLPM